MTAKEILKDLVAINTIADKDNDVIMDYIGNFFTGIGFNVERRKSDETGKEVLIARYGDDPAIGFLGHTDTVDITDGWTTDPFVLTEADGQVLAFDIASDAVKVAARSDAPVKWMVADITNIPVKDGAADVVLDVFTPANYGEFARILAEDGVVIKVVPGANHMAQLRAAAAKQLRSEAYSNEDVLDYFLERFDLLERFTVSRTVPVDRERLADLVNMTPVLFDVDKGLLDLSAVTEITVEGEIVAGRPRNGQDFS